MEALKFLLLLFVACFYFTEKSESEIVKLPLTRNGPSSFPSLRKVKNIFATSLKANKGKTGSTFLTNVGFEYYSVSISVGTPPKEISVMVDTGSPLSWVSSSKICEKNQPYCKNHNVFDDSRSKSYKSTGKKFVVEYQSGRTEGYVGSDTISIAGLKVKNQIFGQATVLDDVMMYLDDNGILGLSLPSNNSIDRIGECLFFTMVKQKVVDKPIYSFYLSKEHNKSELVLGGVDNAHFTGDFTFAPVISQSIWRVKIDKIIFNGKLVIENYKGDIDTGTTLIIGPPDIIDPINKAIGKLGNAGDLTIVDCKSLCIPDVTIVISGTPFTLQRKDYILPAKDDDGNRICISGFISDSSIGHLFLGDVFMRKVYTQFDVEKRQIGFAYAKQ